MKKFRLLMAGLLVLAMALSACSGSKKQETNTGTDTTPKQEAQGPKGTFNYLMTAKPTTFDPAMTSDVPTMQIIQNVYSGLVMNNAKGEPELDMAKDYKVSDDGLTYTFTLKDGLVFSDGTPVKAGDFVRSMVRAMNPALASPVTESYLDDLVGYAKFLGVISQLTADNKDKKISDDEFKAKTAAAFEDLKKDPGVSAPDDKTVVFKIVQPAGYFLAKLTYPTSWPVHPSAPADKEIGASPDNVKYAIGTGAFTLASYTEGDKIVLKANPKFYGAKAKVETVNMPIIEKDQAQLAAYKSGQIDYSPVPTSEYAAVKAELGKEMAEYATARVNYYALNQHVWAPAKDVRVRQAFNYAINKDQLNQVVFSGTQFPAYGTMPPSIPGALGAKVQGLTFDAGKAKQLLKDAGYGDGGKPLPPLKLTYRANNETSLRLAEFLQGQLQANLGVKVTLDPMEWGALLKATQAKNQLESFTLGWSADYIDPQDFLDVLLTSQAPYNRYGYVNKDVDTMVKDGNKMKNGPDRFAKYGQAEQVTVTDAAWVPTHFGKGIILVKPYVKGFGYNAMGILPLNTVEVTK